MPAYVPGPAHTWGRRSCASDRFRMTRGKGTMRPNLHVQDYCDLALLLLKTPAEKAQDEIFNRDIKNMRIMHIVRFGCREPQSLNMTPSVSSLASTYLPSEVNN